MIYPGRTNDDRGADFRDAVVAINQELRRGDIEVHVKSSDWWRHQHHQDPVYNRVILHVVMWHDAKLTSNRHNGKAVPLIALEKYVEAPISQWLDGLYPPATLNMTCVKGAKRLTKDILAEFLDSAGEERFLAKAARFQADLAQMEVSQALYRGIMGALGYSKNKSPFLELADKVPLQILESITRDKILAEGCLAYQQALLLGTAGLLPSQCQDRFQESSLHNSWIGKLEELWASFRQTEVMPLNAWHLFKVRPNNSPVRRIVAMSYLLLRYREKGIFDEVINMVKEAPVNKDCYRLEGGMLVVGNRYWASHFDFGLSTGIKSPTLLGSRRAADVVVNVLLPFAFAWGRVSSQLGLERKAFDLYRSYPKLAVNGVERHMRSQLGLSGNLVNSARRQQGLIHIYNNLCIQGKCGSCPLK